MNWKKRTAAEMDEAVRNKDFTGGYEFWPWLLHMRYWYVIGFLGNLAGGIIGFKSYFEGGGFVDGDPIVLGVGAFFGLFGAPLIAFLLRRDFKEGKQGISR